MTGKYRAYPEYKDSGLSGLTLFRLIGLLRHLNGKLIEMMEVFGGRSLTAQMTL